ncbi:hypothetical protein M5K25_000283 [Dendrobium thyrsiflorum]|uniref:HMA domain-containing protein n=1 Tax=Dendrobium thyrsiflorum TaxID=117978 RepID=A0ABD0VT91_DENTH
MSKEEGLLKKIELKVHVNCCDGCKKKVLKALNIKGVLKTEIHPSLPKVTVTGTVEAASLIKKLAKCGKASELLQMDCVPQPAEKEVKKVSSDSAKEVSKEQIENTEKKKKKKKKEEEEMNIDVPEVSCLVNHGTMPARIHLSEDFRVPMPCYSIVAGQCCARQQGYYDVPTVHLNYAPTMVPVTSPGGAGMVDYFNDENTMGCHVM